jgi:hypothetical protein
MNIWTVLQAAWSENISKTNNTQNPRGPVCPQHSDNWKPGLDMTYKSPRILESPEGFMKTKPLRLPKKPDEVKYTTAVGK